MQKEQKLDLSSKRKAFNERLGGAGVRLSGGVRTNHMPQVNHRVQNNTKNSSGVTYRDSRVQQQEHGPLEVG